MCILEWNKNSFISYRPDVCVFKNAFLYNCLFPSRVSSFSSFLLISPVLVISFSPFFPLISKLVHHLFLLTLFSSFYSCGWQSLLTFISWQQLLFTPLLLSLTFFFYVSVFFCLHQGFKGRYSFEEITPFSSNGLLTESGSFPYPVHPSNSMFPSSSYSLSSPSMSSSFTPFLPLGEFSNQINFSIFFCFMLSSVTEQFQRLSLEKKTNLRLTKGKRWTSNCAKQKQSKWKTKPNRETRTETRRETFLFFTVFRSSLNPSRNAWGTRYKKQFTNSFLSL